MYPLTLYRRAVRSRNIAFMSEVAVRLSADPSNNDLVDSLVEQIAWIEMDKLEDHPTPPERARAIWNGE